MKTTCLLLVALACLTPVRRANATTNSPNTDWFASARYGVFTHFLPADPSGFAQVKAFDAEALAKQLEAMGAGYLVFTLGQNSGYFNAPNTTYDRVTGYAPGERCAARDLPLELHRALEPRGIKLMLYLPCQVPNEDRRAQQAFGLPTAAGDQPLDSAFAKRWSEVIREWSDRYGTRVAGWWFDGAYDHVHFNEEIARLYAEAARHGNPASIVAFNPGVKVVRHTAAEDYTAGELNEPFDTVPASRWLAGAQWHALTYIGTTWGQRNTRHPADRWARWVRTVTDRGGVVTLDMGPNFDPKAGPIGSLAPAQVDQVKAVKAAVRPAAKSPLPKRLKRADSFLGVHFDFHAGPDCKEVGRNTTRGMIETIIELIHPDYLQIDCKGHPGLSSYPTRVGNQAPGIIGDPLRLWREVTAEQGVSLYMHYSGVWDSEAIRQHPDWGVINANGSTNGNAISFFSPYDDRLLIPQLRELAGVYGVNGAWVDGECWASAADYGAPALAAFARATGFQDVPRRPGDPHWYEFLQFNRDAFRRHLRHYVAEVKRTNPAMQICSNWAFTDHMPEAVSAPVDWISGDYSPENSLNSARLSARYIARQGRPWDLMAWSFTTKPGKGGSNRKSVPQLQREAAAVLALGGGFQAYFTQNRDGSVREAELPVMAEVARFCRERQAVCHRAETVPQIALLYSTAAHYRQINGLFNRDLALLQGTLQALLESQCAVDVVSEHHLTGRMAAYPLIIVPETDYLEPAFRRELVTYVRKGGRLLLIGPQSAALFPDVLGARLMNAPAKETRYLADAGTVTPTHDRWQAVTLTTARPLGALQSASNVVAGATPAASLQPLGRGVVAATYFSFSRGYLAQNSPDARRFLAGMVHELFPQPLVEVTGSSEVDVVPTRSHGKLAINLLNTAGPHADPNTPIFDTIPAVGPLEVSLRIRKAAARITVVPGGESLPVSYANGVAHVTLPSLTIHSVLVVD